MLLANDDHSAHITIFGNDLRFLIWKVLVGIRGIAGSERVPQAPLDHRLILLIISTSFESSHEYLKLDNYWTYPGQQYRAALLSVFITNFLTFVLKTITFLLLR